MCPPLKVSARSSRRQFLGAAAGTLLLARAAWSQDAEDAPLAEREAPRLDAHVHISSPELRPSRSCNNGLSSCAEWAKNKQKNTSKIFQRQELTDYTILTLDTFYT